ncbi:hypothetical protein [Flavobacterium phragmitis]|uniref:Uncharacterized protein n=1 Tax=Flavobacterium phragmitis TaxID=739143 RepID=A0A1I1XRU1_9FLAO|nr:hypothetical protein [Flavobacterium phragmitis]SFE08513.1 hypothetical protein SAMN05216297_12028 [Flavobacterium phragmitis]
MKSSIQKTSPIPYAGIQSEIHSVKDCDAAFPGKNSQKVQLLALYGKDNDEPDFDCEFLNAIHSGRVENTIDLDSEDEQSDHFNDNQWDAEIYDPYQESACY